MTRRPPRGVPKSEWGSRGQFDLWFPVIAPSQTLFHRVKDESLDDPKKRAAFFGAYERELNRPEARHVIALLAAIARHMPVAIGCYCENEERCHRSVLRRVVEDVGTRE